MSLLERDQPQLLDAFVQMELEPPDPESCLSILMQSALSWGAIGDTCLEAVEAVHRLHRRFAGYSAPPGRALRFLRNLVRENRRPTPGQVAEAFSRETGLPVALVDDRVPLDLEATRTWFKQRVMGQPEAVERVVERLAAVKTSLTRPGRPIASFLLVGPTGVGKTELARALAEFLFHSPHRMLRFDMSEYSDAWSVQRLIGQSTDQPEPGGAQAGLLTGRVREQPFGVVLFDELEKAHPDFFDLLLQVLGEARLTDASGRLADFSNMVVLMTSNLGAEQMRRPPAGIRSRRAEADFLGPVRAAFRPELFNRLDQVLPFAPLSQQVILEIARRELEKIGRREGIAERKLELGVDPRAASWLARRGCDPRYGARPLKRAIERELLTPLAEGLNRFGPEVPLRATVEVKGDALSVQVTPTSTVEAAEARSRDAQVLVESLSRLRRRAARLADGPLGIRLSNEATAESKTAPAQRPLAPPPPHRGAQAAPLAPPPPHRGAQ
ncbi:MAG: AAA family ATPase, partial [Candidatus Eremiobacterota bacterium]